MTGATWQGKIKSGKIDAPKMGLFWYIVLIAHLLLFFKAKKIVTQSLCGDGGDGSRWAGGCLWGVGWGAGG